MDLLQDSVLKFYAHNLVEVEEIKKIKKFFIEIDSNGDGMLTKEEVENVMTDLGRKEDAQKIFEMMDYEKNNIISYEEFIKALIDRKQLKSEANIKRCFEAIDTKQNGKLSLGEVLDVIFTSNNKQELKEFKETFYKYSNQKEYVRLISYHFKILSSSSKVSLKPNSPMK
jgi:calcium-dependent protein kinase